MKRLVCGLVVVLATSAFAQKEIVVQEPDRTVARKKTTLDFTEVVVGGDYVRPLDGYTLARPTPGFANLIKVRGSFAPELQKSADQL